MIKLKTILITFLLSILGGFIYAQEEHNYFTSQIYPSGLYAKVIFGNNNILFRYPPNQFIKLNYIGQQNGIHYYANSNFKVGVGQNGAFITTIINGQNVVFNYIGPTSSYTGAMNGYPSPSSTNNTNTYSTRRYKCHFCDGKGTVTVNQHITQYTTPDYYVWKKCNICGWEYNSTTTDHRHDTCTHCFGKGYIEK